MRPLTNTQRKVVRFMNRYRDSYQCNPTMEEIATEFMWASPNAAQTHVQLLERKGVLRKREGRARGYIVNFEFTKL